MLAFARQTFNTYHEPPAGNRINKEQKKDGKVHCIPRASTGSWTIKSRRRMTMLNTYHVPLAGSRANNINPVRCALMTARLTRLLCTARFKQIKRLSAQRAQLLNNVFLCFTMGRNPHRHTKLLYGYVNRTRFYYVDYYVDPTVTDGCGFADPPRGGDYKPARGIPQRNVDRSWWRSQISSYAHVT